MKHQLLDQFDEMSLRERLIIAAAALGLVYFIWDFSFFQEYSATRSLKDTQLTRTNNELSKLEVQLNAVKMAKNNGGNVDESKLQRINEMRANNDYLQEQLSEMESRLVTPANMSRLLSQLLSSHKDVELVSMKTLDTEEIILNSAESNSNTRGSASPDAYMHGMLLELKGSYFAILDYIKGVEKSPWSLIWSEVSYRTERNQDGQYTIKIHTYSFTRDWIGV